MSREILPHGWRPHLSRPGRRAVLLPVAGVLSLLASLVAVLSLSTPSARAADPGRPGFLAFSSDRNSELHAVPLPADGGGVEAKAVAGRRLTVRPGLDEHASGHEGQVVFVSTLEDPAGDLYVRDAKGSFRRLLASPGAESEPAFSPDGQWVAFVSSRGGSADIWVVRASDGSGLRRITTDEGAHSSPTWSPDGTRIAYSGTKDNPRGSLYTVTVDAPNTVARLTTPPTGTGDTEPSWGPEHILDPDNPRTVSTIAYTRDAGPGHSRLVRLLTPETGAGTVLDAAVVSADQPAWAPDGGHLAFRGEDGNGQRGIFTTLPHGSGLRIVAPGDDERDPTWTDSATVVATTDQFPSPTDIWAMRPDRTGLADLTRTDDPESDAAYAPDGRHIAYRLEENERYSAIVVANPDGTGPRLVTNPDRTSGVFDANPSWSPDGQRLVFDRQAGGTRRILTVGLDGGGLTDISPPDVTAELGAEDPDWSTKDQIAYVRSTHPFEGPADSHLYVTDPAGRTHTQLTGTTKADAGFQDREPDWSPDGATLVFSRQTSSQQSVLATLRPVAPTGTVTLITTAPPAPTPGGFPPLHHDREPAFSPDGTRVAFTRVRPDTVNESFFQDIWVLTLGVPAAQPLTADLPGHESGPTWQPVTDLAISKTGPAEAQVHGEATYTLTVANHGPADAPDVTVTDMLPAGVDLVRTEASQGSCGTARPLVCALGTLPVGRTATVRVTVRPSQPGVVVNAASVDGRLADSDPSDNAALVRTPVRGADLAVAVVDDPDPVDFGQPLTYRVTVTQRGPDPAKDVALTVPVPVGATVVSATAGQADGTCTTGTSASPPAARCTWPQVAPGDGGPGTRTATVVLRPTRPGTAVSTVSVTSATGEVNPADNTATVETQVRGTDLSVGLAVTPTQAYVGGKVSVHAVVSNVGGGPARAARLVLALPAVACQHPVDGRCAAATVTLPLGDLAPGASAIHDLTLSATAAGRGSVTATALTDTPDAHPADNRVTVDLRVRRPTLVASPPVGPPGFVTLVRGAGFPPGTDVSLTWRPGITPNTAPARVAADGTFVAQMLVIRRDLEGTRKVVAHGTGFSDVTADFLVVSRTVSPPHFLSRG